MDDPDIDIVVELMGGVDPARELISDGAGQGKPVVTANKEVLARHGPELLALAARHGADLFFEGSVAGGIPIIKPLRECLAANRVQAIMGIINGTTNYMLTRMSREGVDFETALREAQALGYAEADPAVRRGRLRRRVQNRYLGVPGLRDAGAGGGRLLRGHLPHHARGHPTTAGSWATR